MLQKALELCGEARGLGGAILAALEKQDGEQLALLRSTHEVGLLESIRALKQKSVEEAEASLAGLLKSRESAELRATLLRESGANQRGRAEEPGQAGGKQAPAAGCGDRGDARRRSCHVHSIVISERAARSAGRTSAALAKPSRLPSGHARRTSRYEANKSGTMAGYDRRLEDWKFQADLAKKEIEQLDKQIIAAEIRKQIAAGRSRRTTSSRSPRRRRSRSSSSSSSPTSSSTASWSRSWRPCTSRPTRWPTSSRCRPQSAFYQELGPDEQGIPAFIKPDNWDSLKKGLLAGDLLQLQLRQMEAAHMAANTRELEITKHVSLFQLDPAALLELRATGSCEFHLPEVLFAMDFAGHYYRRIKAVRITIPCIVGPYANVSATLSLIGSWTRRSTDLSDAEQPVQDLVAAPQTAIATSSANRDGGAFELNFNDPRYLPFEGAGAISSWQLELPSAHPPVRLRRRSPMWSCT